MNGKRIILILAMLGVFMLMGSAYACTDNGDADIPVDDGSDREEENDVPEDIQEEETVEDLEDDQSSVRSEGSSSYARRIIAYRNVTVADEDLITRFKGNLNQAGPTQFKIYCEDLPDGAIGYVLFLRDDGVWIMGCRMNSNYFHNGTVIVPEGGVSDIIVVYTDHELPYGPVPRSVTALYGDYPEGLNLHVSDVICDDSSEVEVTESQTNESSVQEFVSESPVFATYKQKVLGLSSEDIIFFVQEPDEVRINENTIVCIHITERYPWNSYYLAEVTEQEMICYGEITQDKSEFDISWGAKPDTSSRYYVFVLKNGRLYNGVIPHHMISPLYDQVNPGYLEEHAFRFGEESNDSLFLTFESLINDPIQTLNSSGNSSAFSELFYLGITYPERDDPEIINFSLEEILDEL